MKSLTLGALLFTGLAATSLYWELSREPVAMTNAAHTRDADKTVVAPVVPVGNRDISAFLSKPIFSETRSALTQYRAQSGVQETAKRVEQLSGQYRLAGIVLTTEQQFALLHDQKADKSITLALTESVAGWELKELEPTMALFEQHGEKRQLLLKTDIQSVAESDRYDESVLPSVIVMKSQNGVFEDDPYQ